jgi:cobalt/nickel transport system permease protein
LEAIVHIPDGFLTTPVWATLDALALPAAGFAARRAQRGFDDSKAPLLGVMGAFVFAAQMINFPVGVGTSGHLVGGALLSCTLGPAAASVVMTAILIIQSLLFQDGGVLSLGANVWNMAVVGVLAGYLPYYLWGRGRSRRAAIFAGGTLSVLASAVLALAELLLSGVRMPASVLGVSLGFFAVSALIEGAITVAVITSLENIQPGFVRTPAPGRTVLVGAVGLTALLLAAGGLVFASTAPDGIENLAMRAGLSKPLTGYGSGAGVAGVGLIFLMLVLGGRILRKRSA